MPEIKTDLFGECAFQSGNGLGLFTRITTCYSGVTRNILLYSDLYMLIYTKQEFVQFRYLLQSWKHDRSRSVCATCDKRNCMVSSRVLELGRRR